MKHRISTATALLFAFFVFTIPAHAADDEAELLKRLNPEAQEFFKQSMAVRAEYPENHPYKHFNRDRDNNSEIDTMDADGYLWLVPIYVPRNETHTPVMYRLVKDCKTKKTIERQIIDISYGYGNVTLTDRYQQQCIQDGTMDNYYVESSSPPDGE
ncbi:MAG: hypothetical protein ACAH80_08405 [Alphaproteobacteria bacterium]